MPNDDYILRGDALMAIQECFDKELEFSYDNAQSCMNRIKAIPAADMEPVRHGRWKKSYADHEAFGVRPFFRYCSECHEATVHQYNYCPYCGAKMGAEPPKGEDDAEGH